MVLQVRSWISRTLLMAPFSQGLVTWGTTALIIGWVTVFFGLFGLQSDTWMKHDETSFIMYIYVTCPEHGSQRPVDEMKFEIHHEVHIRSYKCRID